MELDTLQQATAMPVGEYVRLQLDGARQALAQAHGLLAQRPAMVAPKDHVDKALGAARNAAEHLYDVAQLDEPEAVREALAAAEAIMVVVRRLDDGRPAFVGGDRQLAAEQLREVDRTLAALERELGIEHLAAAGA